MKNANRTTLLINCSVEEAEQNRTAATKQNRTISAYVLPAVMSRIRIEGHVGNREAFFAKYLEKARGKR